MASVPSAISSPDDAHDENTLGFGIKRGYEKASSDRGVPRTGRSAIYAGSHKRNRNRNLEALPTVSHLSPRQ
jgi:hypothetical protein